MLRSIDTTDLAEVIDYCQQLDQHQKDLGMATNDPLHRFCIGFYQLSGAIDWRHTQCEPESWMSGLIHFLVVMESLSLRPEQYLDRDLLRIERTIPDWQKLLAASARATKMLFYASAPSAQSTSRAKRYDPDKLAHDLGYICRSCVSAVAREERANGIYHATEILAKRL